MAFDAAGLPVADVVGGRSSCGGSALSPLEVGAAPCKSRGRRPNVPAPLDGQNSQTAKSRLSHRDLAAHLDHRSSS